MKRFSKIIVNILAIVMLMLSCFSLVACEDIRRIAITVEVYDMETETMEERTLTIDLYRHLAPDTVDSIVALVNEGYYDSSAEKGELFFYTMGSYKQIMLGNFLYKDEGIEVNGNPPTINGEFNANGVIGSNLTHTEGAIGLWRTWSAEGSYSENDGYANTGSATWFMPTSDLSSSYDGYFCIFGRFNFESGSENNEIWQDIKAMFNNGITYYEKYEVFYTGEYNPEVENCGLTANVIEYDNFKEENISGLFKAEGKFASAPQMYNHYTINVPVINKENGGTKQVGARIVKMEVV
ncbi:MAG: peptidylprolyl isomerase [Clostridia bacterium]|nr:peptidylprolyl isomerase [Clostridia bacterium]